MVLIVTGSSLRAEEADRPLAYYLQQQVEKAAAALDVFPFDPPLVHVVADFRWLHEDALQVQPTISVGGPGVNAVAHRWMEDVPVTLAVDDQYYIQMDPELDELRASVWGMDNPNTQLAVAVFVERFLPRFLERCATADVPAEDPDL
jgi:hypothetical protein